MKPETGFLSLAEELRFYILSFLSCRDILRCASVCKALRQTYISSSELQYIVEMSGQRLLHVSNADNGIQVPVSARLQLLRDKAHAWFKVDINSFEKIILEWSWPTPRKRDVAGGHVYWWNNNTDTARIFPILSKPSQQQFKRNWTPGTLCSVPHSAPLDLVMDPAQNLIAIAYSVDNRSVYIKLGALDSDGAHPQAAGETLFLSEDARNCHRASGAKLKCFGRHIAFLCRLNGSGWGSSNDKWLLQVRDWKHSTTSISILSRTVVFEVNVAINFLFLGNDRLLVLTDKLHLYSIEDMSQAPELLACFLMPLSLVLRCHSLMGDIAPPQPHMQAQLTMYASDPAHRLICFTACSFGVYVPYVVQVFIISTRIFFDLDATAAATPIPWEHWGPSILAEFTLALPVGTGEKKYILHLMDFSPLAVMNSQGLGQVVKEPSTIEVCSSIPGKKSLMTSMPYVQVVFPDRNFKSNELTNIWIDKDRIYLLIENVIPSTILPGPDPVYRYEVIDV
ncbi:hypothetical protein P692DRAFT_201797013 [Suillus brevipes Sb2]|nr:hypothetical protein P692DRAFT_201797013 [Suillus brevipes Sb2]